MASSKRPAFTLTGYCRVCGQEAYISKSGLCENCWGAMRKDRRFASIVRRFVGPYAQAYQNGEPADSVLNRLISDFWGR